MISLAVAAAAMPVGSIDLSCAIFWDDRGATMRMAKAFSTDKPAADHLFRIVIAEPNGRPSLEMAEPSINSHAGKWSGKRQGEKLIFTPQYGRGEEGSGKLVFWFAAQSDLVHVAWDVSMSFGGHIGFGSSARGACRIADLNSVGGAV